jgi:hypothetical protein
MKFKIYFDEYPMGYGGGLVRSAGDWSAVKALRKSDTRMKGDERILGDGDFLKRYSLDTSFS